MTENEKLAAELVEKHKPCCDECLREAIARALDEAEERGQSAISVLADEVVHSRVTFPDSIASPNMRTCRRITDKNEVASKAIKAAESARGGQ